LTKVWFVTGAGSGIGASVARAALRAGDRVIAAGRDLNKLQKNLGNESEFLTFLSLDVSKEPEVNDSIEAAQRRFGRIDVLVNCAGYSVLGNFEELKTAEIEGQFATSFWGVAYLMRAVLPGMRRQRSGNIVNLSSVAGVVGLKHCTAYGAAKFAVEGLSLALAEEVEQFGIKLTIVEPGFFRTDLLNPRNVRYAESTVQDYKVEGPTEAMWSSYDGKQPNDPATLGEAIVQIVAMSDPPRVFVAGSDALGAIRPVLEGRLAEMRAYESLSRASGGAFVIG
jgi:NAD(P)-dependent dehydrogenase (short-subunit alcohol dehydrogenase family)